MTTAFQKSLLALTAATLSLAAQADVRGQWNFNSSPADGNTGTGTILPAIGSGSASLVGGTTQAFNSGDANGGSSDPALGDDSGWQTTSYAAQNGAARGVQFMVSTAGWQDIVLRYDLRHSNTSSRYEAVFVTVDGGATFSQVASFDGNAGDTWFNQRTVDLSAFSAADNNPGFGFRVMQAAAPGGTAYVASNAANSYAATGTWRFDMVTVSALAPVPEPGQPAMMLAGLGLVGAFARRARRAKG